MLMNKKKRFVWLLTIIPFFFGVIGYINEFPGEFLDAAYFSLRLYGLNYDLNYITPVLQIARWMAPLATLTAFFAVIKSISKRISQKISLWKKRT